MKLLDESISCHIEKSRSAEARNQYANLQSIKDLARLMITVVSLRTAVGRVVANQAVKQGYSDDLLSRLRTRILMLPLSEKTAKEAVNAVDAVSKDYIQIYPKLQSSKEKKELAGLFTAGISENIVHQLLLVSDRQLAEIMSDAQVFIGGTRRDNMINSCNVDFFWSRPKAKMAELHECKNTPGRLLELYHTRDVPGNVHKWRRCKLCLMLRTHEELEKASWHVHLACITLRSKEPTNSLIEVLGGKPDELHIYTLEDLGTTFPPELPN